MENLSSNFWIIPLYLLSNLSFLFNLVCTPCTPLLLDLTDFPDAKPGDEIVILGRQGEEEITLEQRMEEWGLTVPRIWTEISAHLDRHYYRDGKLWAVAKDERFILNEN